MSDPSAKATSKSEADPLLPPIAAWFQNGFHRFLRRYLRQNFDRILVCGHEPLADLAAGEKPLLVFGNHPSWWDPIVAHFLNRQLFSPRQFRAPIDAEALQQYQVFKRLGFFGIAANQRQGAADFLKMASAVMRSRHDILWITPEGRFADVRDHDAELMPGMSHVAAKVANGHAIPMAMEYVFWNERKPVCLVKFGEAIQLDDASGKKQELHLEMTDKLRQTQGTLAQLAIDREPGPMENLLIGKGGSGFFYDSARRMKSFFSGKKFQSRHEPVSNPSTESQSEST